MIAATRGARVVEVEAQAKVNLRLRILAREASGFHQIETLFLRLALSDTIRVRRTDGRCHLDVRGDVDLRAIGPAEHNLAWRAASAYLSATNQQSTGFDIQIDKRIPLGAGLGGGSADAGAVLRALDAMSDQPIGEDGVVALAATLGSDVPFMASEQALALGWGRGERLLGLPPLPARECALVVPSFAINTAEAYQWMAESRGESVVGMLVHLETVQDWWQVPSIATNDFEVVVGARYPAIRRYVQGLKDAGCEIAMMSGSGSVVFGIGPERGADTVLKVGDRLIRTLTASRVEPVCRIE